MVAGLGAVGIGVAAPYNVLGGDGAVALVVATGQAANVHGTTCDSAGHAEPPYAGLVTTVRVTVVTPLPQVTEQELDETEVQLDTTQFCAVGHACVLHACVSTSAGQAVPPDDGLTVTVRVRD